MSRSIDCPGSNILVDLVKRRERDDGHEGTYLHWLVAKRAIEELGAIPPEGGLPDPEVPKGYKASKSSLWMVDWCIRHICEVVPDGWALIVEVGFEFEFERWICTGHADIIAQSPDGKKIKGIDWKFVYKSVPPAEENDQFLTYIVLAKLDWPDTEEISFDCCSPRLSGEERITSVMVSGGFLEGCIQSLDKRVCASLDNAMLLKTSLRNCEWCIGCSCPAIQEENKFMEMTLTPEMLAKIKAEPDDALLADFVISARTLRKPMEDATEMLHERLDKNPAIQAGCGMTVTRKIQKGDYEVPEPVKFMQAVRMLLPKDEQIAQAFSPSMTKIKDLIAAHNDVPKTGKAAITAESIFDGHLRPLVIQGEKRVLQIS